MSKAKKIVLIVLSVILIIGILSGVLIYKINRDKKLLELQNIFMLIFI